MERSVTLVRTPPKHPGWGNSWKPIGGSNYRFRFCHTGMRRVFRNLDTSVNKVRLVATNKKPQDMTGWRKWKKDYSYDGLSYTMVRTMKMPQEVPWGVESLLLQMPGDAVYVRCDVLE